MIGIQSHSVSRPRPYKTALMIAALIATNIASSRLVSATQDKSEAGRYDVLRLSEVPRIAENVGMKINAMGDVCFWKEMEDHTLRAAVWRNGNVIVLKLPAGYRNALIR